MYLVLSYLMHKVYITISNLQMYIILDVKLYS